jgi:lipid-A-disaccharide synthase
VNNETYALLLKSKAALVTSGTATLETALFSVPQVVCYKTSNISYAIGKRLVKIKFISLVNLIMNKPVLKELIQQDLHTQMLVDELERLLHNEIYSKQMKDNYNELWNKLQADGNASEKAANFVIELAKSGLA